MKKIFLVLLICITLKASDYGELLFSGNCVTCHFKTEKKSAPSILEIRKHYLNAFPKEEDFINYMITWVLKPKAETSIMSHSIKEFELMPELGYDEYTLRQIAKYIYKTDFSKQP